MITLARASLLSTYEFISENQRWLGVGFALFFLSSLGQTYFIGLSIDDIRREFGLSHGDIGLINMVLTLLSGIAVFAAGTWSDQLSSRALIAILLPALAVGALMFQSMVSMPVVLLGLLILRIFAQGFLTHVAFVLVGRWFRKHRGMAIAVTSLGQNIGQMLLPLSFVSISTVIGWQASWILIAVALLLLAPFLMRLASKERAVASDVSSAGKADSGRVVHGLTRAEVLARPEFYAFVFAILPMALVANTIFFHQVYLTETRNWDLEIFTVSYSAMAVSTIVAGFVAGWMVDRFSAVALLPYYLIPLVMACLILSVGESTWVIVPFMVLAGISNGFSLNLYGAVWAEAFGTEHLGAVRSVVTMTVIFAAAVGPALAGVLLDAGFGFGMIFSLLSGLCVTASVAVWPFARQAKSM
jgi:sugar phosphate permease